MCKTVRLCWHVYITYDLLKGEMFAPWHIIGAGHDAFVFCWTVLFSLEVLVFSTTMNGYPHPDF